jgi:uncharacterized protein (DUF1800 family)
LPTDPASSRDLRAAIAVTRFGLGARPGELEMVRADPQAWLLNQIRRDGADQPQTNPASAAQRYAEVRDYTQQRRQERKAGDFDKTDKQDPVKMAARLLRDDTGADFLARAQLASSTDASFRERWTLFWCNHFTVSATKLVTATLVGPFEQEAIRPRVFGRFDNLLLASSTHPAMLTYLDQAQSIGPHSQAAERFGAGANGKPKGLNENLAREIMELHTVGVGAGYTQADVTEFARAMTGYSIAGPRDAEQAGRFVFRQAAHEPGVRHVMGKSYAQSDGYQAWGVMQDLAANPHTAEHIASKLAAHFVADDPPPALVERLKANFLQTRGDLGALAQTLVTAPEAWDPQPQKFKTPYEFMVSSWRATGTVPQGLQGVAPVLNSMGQKAFSAPSPKGWSEEAAVWCAPDAIVKRMAWSEGFAAGAIGDRDPVQLAQGALGARLTPLVAQAIARAETRPEGLSILLMSPEFQRR